MIPKRWTLRSQILALTLAVGAVVWALSLVLDSEKEAATARVRSTSVQVANTLALLLRSGWLSDAALAEARALAVQVILMKEHTVEKLPSLVGRLLALPA